MESFELETFLDPQPGLDVESSLSDLDSNGPETPMDVEVPEPPSPGSVKYTKTSLYSDGVDHRPLFIRSCRVARARVPRRYPSPDSSSDESTSSLYAPSPRVRPIRIRSATQDTAEDRSESPPLISVKPENSSSSSPPASQPIERTKTASKCKPTPKPKPKRGGGRKGEPRRTQNMVAQKKYRDKRVHVARLMSDTIVQLRLQLDSDHQQSPETCLALVRSIICQYQAKVQVLFLIPTSLQSRIMPSNVTLFNTIGKIVRYVPDTTQVTPLKSSIRLVVSIV